MFKSVITCHRTISSSHVTKNSLRYATYRSTAKNGEFTSANFIIGSDLMKKMRWQFGDRINVLRDPESQLGLLKRTLNGGRKLTKAASGNYGRVYIAINHHFPVVDSLTTLENVTVTEEGILFCWPQEAKQGTLKWPSVIKKGVNE